MADPAGTVRTTTVREVIPPGTKPQPKATDGQIPDFWDYFASIIPSDWEYHTLYIYREDPSPRSQIERIGQLPNSNFLVIYDERRQAIEKLYLTGKEETEYAIGRKWGGKAYLLMLKVGRTSEQRMTSTKIYIEAPPKYPFALADGGQPVGLPITPGPSTPGMDGTYNIAAKAIDTVAGHEAQAVNLGLAMMNTAANTIRQFSEGRQPSDSDQMFKMLQLKLFERLIDKMDAPVPAAANPMGGMPWELVMKMLTAAVDRFMAGPAAAAAATGNPVSTSAALVGQLPAIAGMVRDGISEWARGMEAQARAVEAQANIARTQPHALPAPQQPAAAPQPATNGAAKPPNGAPPMIPQVIETALVNILQEQISAHDAADKALEFLETLDQAENGDNRQIVPTLYRLGKQNLFAQFQRSPKLRQFITANPARVREVIEEFFKILEENLPPKTDA